MGTKVHPSIVIYKVASRDEAEVIVNGHTEYVGTAADSYARARSEGLWQIDATPPVPARRTPRQSEWEWQ